MTTTAHQSPQPQSPPPSSPPRPEPAPPPDNDNGDDGNGDDTIVITRTYEFAGQVHTETKRVARSSAEAALYLASNPAPTSRPAPRRAFRSIFEPASDQTSSRRDLNLTLKAMQGKAQKLNVVEKSRLDWAGYVDQEGLGDDLRQAGRSKEAYAGQEAFLARSDWKREEDAKRARGVIS